MAKIFLINSIKNYISLATATFYPSWPFEKSDKVRGDLAIETFKEIKKMGLPLYTSDGGSSESFLSEISNLGYKIYKQKNRGLSVGRRQALTHASLKKGSLAILLFEPEKVSFIKDCLIKSVQPILENQADIDFSFGPKIFLNKPHILNLFLDKYTAKNISDENKFQCEVWANALFFPLFVALYKGLRVISSPISYIHPTSQTLLESNNPLFIRKRDYQFKTLLTATKEFILLLENNHMSSIKYSGRFYG